MEAKQHLTQVVNSLIKNDKEAAKEAYRAYINLKSAKILGEKKEDKSEEKKRDDKDAKKDDKKENEDS